MSSSIDIEENNVVPPPPEDSPPNNDTATPLAIPAAPKTKLASARKKSLFHVAAAGSSNRLRPKGSKSPELLTAPDGQAPSRPKGGPLSTHMLVAPMSVNENNSRGVFIRPMTSSNAPIPTLPSLSSSTTTTSSSSSSSSLTSPHTSNSFIKSFTTDGYLIGHDANSVSIIPIALTNEPTKCSTDTNFHLDVQDRPSLHSALTFSMRHFSPAAQQFLASGQGKATATNGTDVATAAAAADVANLQQQPPPNEWKVSQLLHYPLPQLTPEDLATHSSSFSHWNPINLASLRHWVKTTHAATATAYTSASFTDITAIAIISIVPLHQLDCVSQLRALLIPNNVKWALPWLYCRDIHSFGQPITSPQDITLHRFFAASSAQHSGSTPHDASLTNPNMTGLSDSLTMRIPNISIVDLTNVSLVSQYLLSNSAAEKIAPQNALFLDKMVVSTSSSTSSSSTTPTQSIPFSNASIVDVIITSEHANSFYIATSTTTTFHCRIIQGIMLPIGVIDPFFLLQQFTVLKELIEASCQDKTNGTTTSASPPQSAILQQMFDNASLRKNIVQISAMAYSARSEHNLFAIGYHVLPPITTHPSGRVVQQAPIYQIIILFSLNSLLPVSVLSFDPHVQTLLQLQYEENDAKSSASQSISHHGGLSNGFQTKHQPQESQQRTTTIPISTAHTATLTSGLPFFESINAIELSRSGLHLVVTTIYNVIFIYCFCTNQWIRFVLPSSLGGGSGLVNATSSAPTNASASQLIPSCLLLLHDALRIVVSDSVHGSEYELLPEALHSFLPHLFLFLPHARQTAMATQVKLLELITGRKAEELQNSPLYHALQQLSNTDIRITGINSSIHFLVLTTDKIKTRRLTLVSCDTHHTFQHHALANTTPGQLSQQSSPQSSTLTTSQSNGLFSGALHYSPTLSSWFNCSTLTLPRLELAGIKRSLLVYDHLRDIVFLTSAGGERDIFCIEIRKQHLSLHSSAFLTDQHGSNPISPHHLSTAHKEAARRASVISLGGMNKQSAVTSASYGQSHNTPISTILPYVTTYSPLSMSLHFLNKHTLQQPVMTMSLRYVRHNTSTSWPFLVTTRIASGQKGRVLCSELLELKRRAGVLSHSHRDSVFSFGSAAAAATAAAAAADPVDDMSRNQQLKANAFESFVLNLIANAYSQSNPTLNRRQLREMSLSGIFFTTNLNHIHIQFTLCDCLGQDQIITFQQQIDTRRQSLAISTLESQSIQDHLQLQSQSNQQRLRIASQAAVTPSPRGFGKNLSIAIPGTPQTSNSFDPIVLDTPRSRHAAQPDNSTLGVLTEEHDELPPPPSDEDDLDTFPAPTQPAALDADGQQAQPLDNVAQAPEDTPPYRIQFYDDPAYRHPPTQLFDVSTDAFDMIDKPSGYNDVLRAKVMTPQEIEMAHFELQNSLHAQFPSYNAVLSDLQVIELVYRDQVLDLQARLAAAYLEMDVLQEANAILKDENNFVCHENKVLQQQRDMLLDILKLRINDLYSNNMFSNAYLANGHTIIPNNNAVPSDHVTEFAQHGADITKTAKAKAKVGVLWNRLRDKDGVAMSNPAEKHNPSGFNAPSSSLKKASNPISGPFNTFLAPELRDYSAADGPSPLLSPHGRNNGGQGFTNDQQKVLKTAQKARIVGTAPTLDTLFDDDDADCAITHNPLQSENPSAAQAALNVPANDLMSPRARHQAQTATPGANHSSSPSLDPSGFALPQAAIGQNKPTNTSAPLPLDGDITPPPPSTMSDEEIPPLPSGHSYDDDFLPPPPDDTPPVTPVVGTPENNNVSALLARANSHQDQKTTPVRNNHSNNDEQLTTRSKLVLLKDRRAAGNTVKVHLPSQPMTAKHDVIRRMSAFKPLLVNQDVSNSTAAAAAGRSVPFNAKKQTQFQRITRSKQSFIATRPPRPTNPSQHPHNPQPMIFVTEEKVPSRQSIFQKARAQKSASVAATAPTPHTNDHYAPSQQPQAQTTQQPSQQENVSSLTNENDRGVDYMRSYTGEQQTRLKTKDEHAICDTLINPQACLLINDCIAEHEMQERAFFIAEETLETLQTAQQLRQDHALYDDDPNQQNTSNSMLTVSKSINDEIEPTSSETAHNLTSTQTTYLGDVYLSQQPQALHDMKHAHTLSQIELASDIYQQERRAYNQRHSIRTNEVNYSNNPLFSTQKQQDISSQLAAADGASSGSLTALTSPSSKQQQQQQQQRFPHSSAAHGRMSIASHSSNSDSDLFSTLHKQMAQQ